MTRTDLCDTNMSDAKTNGVFLKIDGGRVAESLREVLQKLDSPQGEAVLDFTAVRRVDAAAVQALEDLARVTASRSTKIGLRGVNVEIYKVLKLMNLARRFSFVN